MAKKKESERPKVEPKFSKEELAESTEKSVEEWTREFWIRECGMPTHLKGKQAKEWAEEKKNEEKKALESNTELFALHTRQVAELFRERLLKAGFTPAELDDMDRRESKNPQYVGLPGRFLNVRGDDSRFKAFMDALTQYRREWGETLNRLAIQDSTEPDQSDEVNTPVATDVTWSPPKTITEWCKELKRTKKTLYNWRVKDPTKFRELIDGRIEIDLSYLSSR